MLRLSNRLLFSNSRNDQNLRPRGRIQQNSPSLSSPTMSDEEYVSDAENHFEETIEALHEQVVDNELPHLVDYEDEGVFINANNTGPNFVVGQPVNQYYRNNDVGVNNEGNPFNGFVNYINGNPRNNAGNIPVNNGGNNAIVRNNVNGNPANNVMHNDVINNNVNNNIPRNQGINPPRNGGNVPPRNNQPRNGGVIPPRNNQPRNNPPENRGDDEEQNIFRLANTRDGAIMSYAIPNLSQLHTGIRRPHIGATHFSLKPIMFTMLQANGQFAGLPSEDPHSHLRSFMEITDSFLIPHVSDDALRLKLFPFSLRDRARAWYNSLTPDSVITWNQMAEKFLKKYFPPTRNAKSRNEICTFKQMDDEAVPDAWERYKELLRKCPHHGIPYCIQLETFYGGLNATAKQMLDATAGGAFTVCTYNQGIEILEKISNNNGQWSDPRAVPVKKASGGTEVDAVTALTTQLTKLISNLTTGQQVRSDVMAVQSDVQPVQCVYCGEGHSFEHCPGNPEQVNFVNKTGPFSQTYNPGWRQHPNFSWNSPALNPPMQKQQEPSNFQNQGQSNFQNQKQPNFQNHGQSNFNSNQGSHNNQQGHFQNNHSNYQNRPRQNAESSVSLETLMKGFMTQTQASIKNLETQVGQMALEIRKRPVGALPSDTEIPHREGKEHVKSITLRSGKVLPEVKQKVLENPIKAGTEKSSTALNSEISTQTSDDIGPKTTSKPTSTTSVPKEQKLLL